MSPLIIIATAAVLLAIVLFFEVKEKPVVGLAAKAPLSILFVATALGVSAVHMIVRDVVVRRRQAIDVRLSQQNRLPPRADADARVGQQSAAPADDWLERLVAESGLEISGTTGVLLALAQTLFARCPGSVSGRPVVRTIFGTSLSTIEVLDGIFP